MGGIAAERRPGIALVVVSGLLSLFLFLGVSILRLGRPDGRARTAQLELAAESGLSYAAARLSLNPCPRRDKTVEGRAESWAPREPRGTPLAAMRNPSYARGEHWQDAPLPADLVDNDDDGAVDEAGEGMGLFTPGEPILADLDGDGRFSAWSGRLRGGAGPFGLRFSLAVGSPEGRIPLNAGSLEGADRYGSPAAFAGPDGPNGVPDHKDPDIHHHKALVHVLNNLGVVRGITGRRRDVASCGDPIRCSWLGQDLVSNRPVGGYRDWAQVRSTLLGLSFAAGAGPPYTVSDVAAIEPFISLETEGPLSEGGRCTGYETSDFPRYVPVVLAAAPREVLVSLFLYLMSAPDWNWQNFPGEPGSDARASSRTGAAALKFFGGGIPLNAIVFPDEAENLADLLVQFRRANSPGWRQLHADLLAQSLSLFPQDSLDIDPTAHPIFARHWTQLKADIAFQAIALDVTVSISNSFGITRVWNLPATWGGWDLDRDFDLANGVQQRPLATFSYIRRVRYVPSPATAAYAPLDIPFQASVLQPSDFMKAQGISLAPPCRFDVEALAVSGDGPSGVLRGLSGSLRCGERLDLFSQEDFENLSRGATLAKSGIAVDDPVPDQRKDTRPDPATAENPQGRPTPYPHVVTLPRWSRRSVTSQVSGAPLWGCSRAAGAVALAARESGPQPVLGTHAYWTFKEDFDGAMSQEDDSEGPVAATPWPLKLPGMHVEDLLVHPYHVDAEIPFPGTASFAPFGGNGGPVIPEGSVSAWIPTNSQAFSVLDLNIQNGALGFLKISARRHWVLPDRPGTLFEVDVKWPSFGTPVVMDSPAFFVEDGARPRPHTPWTHHVVLTFTNHGSQTAFALHVDGEHQFPSQTPPVPPMSWTGSGAMDDVTLYKVSLKGQADEVRFHTRALSGGPGGEVQSLFNLGRITKYGRFASPTYVFDAPTRLGSCSWTGTIPPELSFDPFLVEVEGFATAPGDPGHPQPAWPSRPLLPSGRLDDLSGLAPVRSFRYRVTMDCLAVPPGTPLLDSPVFESIWFMFARPGRSPAWLSR